MDVSIESGRAPFRDQASRTVLLDLTRRIQVRSDILRTLLIADVVLIPVSLVTAFGFNINEMLASQASSFSFSSSLLDWLAVTYLRDFFMLIFLWRSERAMPSAEESCRHARSARWLATAVFLYGIGRLSEVEWRHSAYKLTLTFSLTSIMAPALVLAAHVLLKCHEHHKCASGQQADMDEQDDQYSSELTFWQTLGVMKPYFWPSNGKAREVLTNRARALSTWVFVAGARGANLLSPLFLARATNAMEAQLDSGIRGALSAEVVQNLIYYAFVLFLSKTLKELQSLVYIKVQQAAYVEIAENTFAHLHDLDLDWHLKKKMGNVISSIDRGVHAAQQVMQYVFLYLLPTLLESIAVGLIFILRFKNMRLAIFLFLNLYLYCYVTVKVTLWRKRFRTATTKHDNELHDRMTDSLVNYETIKYFTAEDYEQHEYKNVVQMFQQMSMATQASLSLLNIVQQLVLAFTLAGGMIIACVHLLESGGSLGDFVAVNVYIVQTFAPLNFLATIYNMAINALVDMRNFGQLLAETSEVRDAPNARVLDAASDNSCPMIEFRNVAFHYRHQPHERALRGISFSTPRGGTTALVGTTGAGKTTITRLLFRFYDPVAGKVLVNGQDARSVTQKSLRQAIGFVPQDVVMFNATIAHNIKYGNIYSCTQQDMEDAAAKAQLLEFIGQQVDRYETLVGERGLKLSGGEKQRLAIARCLVKNPPIIVLDEATSALDSQTEQKIQQALDVLSASRTVLAIAHRLSTVRSFQQILVLEHGKIVERGTHDELLHGGERYSDMWRRQATTTDEDSEDVDVWRRQALSNESTSAPPSPTTSISTPVPAPAEPEDAQPDVQRCPISGKISKEGESSCPMAMILGGTPSARGGGSSRNFRGRGSRSPRAQSTLF